MVRKALCSLWIASIGGACLAQADEGYFDSNGVKIHYVTAGEGEAIVLVHGWMSDSTMWGRDAAGNTKLETKGMPGFQVIAMDCRGHGKSDKPHGKDAYGVEMATDVVRLLDHLKIKRAHLVGYSMGAFIVGKVAVTHPERVISVVYGGQAPIVSGAIAPGSGTNEVEVFAKAVEEGKGLGSYFMYVAPTAFSKMTLEQANNYTEFLYRGKDVKAFAMAGMSLGDLAVTSGDLKKCTMPALFIHGGNESDYVKRSVAAARKVLTQSDEKVIEGGTHVTTMSNPEFGLSLMKFLMENKTR